MTMDLKTKNGRITVASVVAAFLAVAGVYQAAPALGIQMPRPAWLFELQQLERKHSRWFQTVADDRVEELRQEVQQAQWAIQRIHAEGEQEVPDWLLQKYIDAQRELNQWEDLLSEAQNARRVR